MTQRFRLSMTCIVAIVLVCLLHSATSVVATDDLTLNVKDVGQLLGREFRLTKTTHFHVYSDADATWTRQQSALLERAYHQFHRVAKRLRGIDLQLPEEDLVCILFQKQTDFKGFARINDQVESSWISGYYASGANYIVFYQTADEPALIRIQAELDQMQDQVDEAKSLAHDARRQRDMRRAKWYEDQAQSMQAHVNKEADRIAKHTKGASTAKTIHEAIHQLSYNTGLQSRYRRYPFWFSEGLAVSFETDNASGAFGPGFESDVRRERFNELLMTNQLLTLDSFIGLDHVPNDDEHTADVMYHESYALFRWLFRFRRNELAEYASRMAVDPNAQSSLQSDVTSKKTSVIPAGDLTASQHRAIFIECFGAIDSLQKQWLRWELQQ